MPKIGFVVRTDVGLRLAGVQAAGNGFNGNFIAAMSTYGLDPSIIGWPSAGIDFPTSAIDIPPAKPYNFFYGDVNPDLMEESTAFTYPMMSVDVATSSHAPGSQSYVKGATFAGPVVAVIRFHLSWKSEDVPRNLAAWGDAVEDAMFGTITNPNYQAWTFNNVFGGPLMLTRGPITGDGEGLRRSYLFQGTWDMVVA
jgi:hypothetical protein